jgi:glycosyltransferase involved in cell wall biosynthesis
MKSLILIPAYKPSEDMITFMSRLRQISNEAVLIINDGSGHDFDKMFDHVRRFQNVFVVNHEVNKGKGAALKTGFKYALSNFPDVKKIITADADGQHHENDVKKIIEYMKEDENSLFLGSRTFGKEVPFRSKIGNIITRNIFRYIYKVKISDTQSGLRGLQVSHLKHFLDIPYNGYEFETEMLLKCSKNNIKIKEISIETIYKDNNSSSHFNPLLDSLKIYFVIFRYTISSLLSALVDFLVFILVYPLINNILISTYASRCVSLFVNYSLVSKKVFVDSEKKGTFVKYITLVIISGALSSGLIYILSRKMGIPVNISKIISETILYIVNFVIQKEVIFKKAKRM